MDIYGENGYLDINRIKKSPFMFLIGARRTGKTYGVSKYLLDNKRKFMYIRRTTGELEFSMASGTFAFKNMEAEGHYLSAKKDGKYKYNILNDQDEIIGIATSLTLVSKMRGFDGSEITDIMFDEFIPEKHVARIPHEGDAVLNMYETINGNRELEGKPPVRLWLLANSNNLNSEIIGAFSLRQKIEQMQNKGQEYSEYKNTTIVLSGYSPISMLKRDTALYQMLEDNQFTEMALSNSFSYDDFSNIQNRYNINEYRPRCRIGSYVVLNHKSNGRVLIIKNETMPVTQRYDFTDYSLKAFRMSNTDLLSCYVWGWLSFDSYDTKAAIMTALPYIQ